MGRKGVACPECGAEASALHGNAQVFTPKAAIRGKRCDNGHVFLTVESALTIDTLEFKPHQFLRLIRESRS